jgi:hypothetical protein
VVWSTPGETLDMIIVPTTGVFPHKVFCTKCSEEEFVIGQILRWSGVELLYRTPPDYYELSMSTVQNSQKKKQMDLRKQKNLSFS